MLAPSSFDTKPVSFTGTTLVDVILDLSKYTVISNLDLTVLVDVGFVTLVFSINTFIFDFYSTVLSNEMFRLTSSQCLETSCCHLNYISGLYTDFSFNCTGISDIDSIVMAEVLVTIVLISDTRLSDI